LLFIGALVWQLRECFMEGSKENDDEDKTAEKKDGAAVN
jgi:hypothetical protein